MTIYNREALIKETRNLECTKDVLCAGEWFQREGCRGERDIKKLDVRLKWKL